MTEFAVTRESTQLVGRRWIFGSAVLDERSLELHVGGQPVELECKPREVLLYLLHHAGEVVTKDDLGENLWPGRILTETVLTRCISLLRQALKDNDRTLIRTVHGYGYRLVARVRVEASATPPPPAFDFKSGDSPPTRPQWRLVERLGTGGHGEAWLARHEKTGDARVFKFALDAGALSSLKREITLYRLLHDSLGARVAIARIQEWNLEEPPYFIEMEYVAGGNLQAWSESQGGLSGVPLTVRLELVAQVAEALAAAHSVGALHKDLKPGNVLVQIAKDGPTIRLCDFGSGTVLDPSRLDALGITRLGFTKTLAQDFASATPLYLAPEVITGQPFTVQADIYALGILLYQVVTGDLRKALAPGWEADIEDELLREDIAAAAAGNPALRLTDAAQLAERLRTLEQRRQARAAEIAARQRGARARRIQQELRRTRVFALALLVLSVAAIVAGVTVYRARNDAVAATATATAVSDFLMEDVLRIDSGLFRTSEASYEALLNRAAVEVGSRLRDQPKAAASIHWLLGRRYQEIGRFEVAARQYERSAALFTSLYGQAADPTLLVLDRLAWVYMESGQVREALATSERMRALWASRLRPTNLAMLMVRIRIARTVIAAGDYSTAEKELRAVMTESANADPSPEQVTKLFKEWLGITPPPEAASQVLTAYANLLLAGVVLEEVGDGYAEAESRLRDSLAIFSKALGEENELLALTNFALAIALASSGKYAEAEEPALRAHGYFDKSLPARHFARGIPNVAMGRLRIEQRRLPEAVSLLKAAVDLCSLDSGCPPRVRAEFLWELGRAYDELGREEAAIQAFHASLDTHERLYGSSHVATLRIRVGLADALRQIGRSEEASTVVSAINEVATAGLRPYQQARADLRRTEGMLSLQAGEAHTAAAALQESFEIVNHRLGVGHWRTEQASTELAAARRVAGATNHK